MRFKAQLEPAETLENGHVTQRGKLVRKALQLKTVSVHFQSVYHMLNFRVKQQPKVMISLMKIKETERRKKELDPTIG